MARRAIAAEPVSARTIRSSLAWLPTAEATVPLSCSPRLIAPPNRKGNASNATSGIPERESADHEKVAVAGPYKWLNSLNLMSDAGHRHKYCNGCQHDRRCKVKPQAPWLGRDQGGHSHEMNLYHSPKLCRVVVPEVAGQDGH
jgi:hypothetical protein